MDIFFLVISTVLASLCKGAGVCRKTQKDGGKEEWSFNEKNLRKLFSDQYVVSTLQQQRELQTGKAVGRLWGSAAGVQGICR